MKNKRKGFTLAEILITLTLIGAIAAMTIPSLVNNINNATNVIQLKKTFSDLQQAFMLLQAENGGSIVPVFQNDIAATGGANVMNAFLTKLNYIKNCGSAMGCLYNTSPYLLNGSTYISPWDTYSNGKYGKAILSNGVMIVMGMRSTNCTATGDGIGGTGPLLNNTCGVLIVDINGSSSPNMLGRDFFYFWITQSGIYPFGSHNGGYYCATTPGNISYSAGCTVKVLTEGAMNY